jgi:hypothetical protein
MKSKAQQSLRQYRPEDVFESFLFHALKNGATSLDEKTLVLAFSHVQGNTEYKTNMHYFNFFDTDKNVFCDAITRCLFKLREDQKMIDLAETSPRRYKFVPDARRPGEPKEASLRDLGAALYQEYLSILQPSQS